MDHLLTVKAAAARLGTTERHVRDLVYRRAIPFVKVGRLVRFEPDELAAWIAANRHTAEGGGGR